MQEWEAIFLDTPRLYECVDVLFRGKKCQTSHIASVEKLEGTEPLQYRVRTMSGGLYVGPVGTEADLAEPVPDTMS